MHKIATSIAENTAFSSLAEQNTFLESISILYISQKELFELEQEIGTTNNLKQVQHPGAVAKDQGSKTSDRLEFFVDSMWDDASQ